jgi:hypothetical protein
MAEIHWKREFDALGMQGVRGALTSGRWDDAKRAAAREWLERADAKQWQATRHGEGSGAPSAFDALRRYKWIYFAAGGAFGLLGLAQVLAKLF